MTSNWIIPLLFLAGLCAGFVDSIAGGGGLITLPVLLNVGIPPELALGTNKLQATFGSGSVNVLAAVQFVENHFKGLLPTTEIAGEQSAPSGILTNYSANGQQQLFFGNSIVWSGSLLRGNSSVWAGSIVWSGSAPAANNRPSGPLRVL